MIINFCWYVYGGMIFSDQIKYCYIIGSCINLVLMVIYLVYEIRRFLVDTILNTLILVTGTWALYRALTIIIDDDRIVGKICVGTSCIVFLNQVQIVYKVLKDRNYNLIPIYNCWIALFSSIWSLVQVIVYINFSRKYPPPGKAEFSSTIGIETTPNDEIKKEETPIKIDEENDVKGKEKPVKIYNN